MALTLISDKNYVVDVPTLGVWGTVSSVEVTNTMTHVQEHQGIDMEFDSVSIGGQKVEISFDYTYIHSASSPPETLLAAKAPVALTDLSTGGVLPGKFLFTEVKHSYKKGEETTASCSGAYYPGITDFATS